VEPIYWRKEVVPAAAIKEAGIHAALLESAVRSRKDIDRCVPAFQPGLYRRERRGDLVLLGFLRDILGGAYCSAGKEDWLAGWISYFMANLLLEKNRLSQFRFFFTAKTHSRATTKIFHHRGHGGTRRKSKIKA
jgi:hypothetical protein